MRRSRAFTWVTWPVALSIRISKAPTPVLFSRIEA
jgi:hypothetical protein